MWAFVGFSATDEEGDLHAICHPVYAKSAASSKPIVTDVVLGEACQGWQ